MTIELITALIVFAFVASITPGPNNLMLLASGTNFGFRRTIPHMLGVGIGFTVMVVLVGVGLIGLFDAWPVSYLILKFFSVIYLLYLAYRIASAAPPENTDGDIVTDAKPFTFLQAALFQWVNPKAWTMALTAISVYAPPDHPIGAILIVALIFGLINLPSVSSWVLLGTQLRRLLDNPFKLRLFNCVAALLLVASLYPVFLA